MMNADAATAALERLAIKHGVMPGNLKRPDLLLCLALASLCLPNSAPFTEPQVNALLKAWLAGTGAMLDVDHVELRRALVDAGLWQRDGFGRAYERATSMPDAELAAIVGALAALDAPQIIAAARARRDADRAERKSRHVPT